MNADIVVVYNGEPSASLASAAITTTAALPLSNMSTTRDWTVADPSTGSARCSVTDCWPCTSSAGLYVPIMPIALIALPAPITTGNVGKACCGTPAVFSVV